MDIFEDESFDGAWNRFDKAVEETTGYRLDFYKQWARIYEQVQITNYKYFYYREVAKVSVTQYNIQKRVNSHTKILLPYIT